MSEKLPNWNLEDFYLNLKDDQINVDLDIFKNFLSLLIKSIKDKLRNIQIVLNL
jgi:hypothetical protein